MNGLSAPKKVVAFALYPGVTPLDVVGPLTVLRKVGFGWPFETAVVAERVEPIASDTPMEIVPTHTFADVPAPYAMIVPGGGPAALRAIEDKALLTYVRTAAATAKVVGSTGNGALILAAAGLLAGRRAAVHRAYAELLETLGATHSREQWTEDGKFLTEAGGSAGIDAMLHLVAKHKGVATSKLAQLATEYDPDPPFGGLTRTPTHAVDSANRPARDHALTGASR